eukprot:TRINITY_DN858_c0_g1_i1.p1 TRINITY_DN858_c0_g1~~TRINITY_DN858_c0_g1_i1.p1  ORF type:complete len:226 (-),score=15.71 TRINITY_DN858_c0_g1_i1:39-671(-)
MLQEKNERFLIIIGTYSIGKERVLLKIAEETRRKLFVDSKKYDTLKLLDLPCSFEDTFTIDASRTCLHVTSMWNISFQSLWKLTQGGRFTQVVGFKPTGWSGEIKKQQRTKNNKFNSSAVTLNTVLLVNYRIAYGSLILVKIIPTVGNKNRASVDKMERLTENSNNEMTGQNKTERNFLGSRWNSVFELAFHLFNYVLSKLFVPVQKSKK